MWVLFVAFSGIFVKTNPTRGPFIASSGISTNTNPNRGHKENLFTHLPYKRRRGGGGEGLMVG